LSATYGDLSDPKSCIEVTQQLRDMCTGDRLEIQGGIEKSKLPGNTPFRLILVLPF